MVDLSSINAKIKEIKGMNNSEKENPYDCPRHVNDYFGLRNLLYEVKQSFQQEVSHIIYSYRNPFVPEGLSRNDIRNTYRKIINDAEKHGLEDMDINHRDLLNIDNKDCMIEFNTKDCKLTISENVRGEDEWAGTHYEEIYFKQFNSTLDMLNAYFDAVDNNYQFIKDYLNKQDFVIEELINCDTREEVFPAFLEALGKAGWEIKCIEGSYYDDYELTYAPPVGKEGLVWHLDCEISYNKMSCRIRRDLNDIYGNNIDRKDSSFRKILEKTADIAEKCADLYDELPKRKAKGKSHHGFEL